MQKLVPLLDCLAVLSLGQVGLLRSLSRSLQFPTAPKLLFQLRNSLETGTHLGLPGTLTLQLLPAAAKGGALLLHLSEVCDLLLKDTMKPQYFDLTGLNLEAASGEEVHFRFLIADVWPGDKYADTALTGIEIEFLTPNH